MKIFTRILFALFVVFTSVDVYADYNITCPVGQFIPKNGTECAPCPKGCEVGFKIEDTGTHCFACTDTDLNFCKASKGFYCDEEVHYEGDIPPQSQFGRKDCDSKYRMSDLENTSKDTCYAEIPFEIGTGASFHSQSADSDGLVLERMYYSYSGSDTVFEYAGAGTHKLKTGYLFGGSEVPSKPGFLFSHWKKHDDCASLSLGGGGVPDVIIDDTTNIEPDWSPSPGFNQIQCTKIIAVWCDTSKQTVDATNGKCICKKGYYGNDETCTRCPDGKTTPDAGASSPSECTYIFTRPGGTWKWPSNVENVEINSGAFNHP